MTSKAQQAKDKVTLLKAVKAWSKALERKDLDALTANSHRNIHLFDIHPPYQTKGIKAYRKLWEQSLAHFPDKFKSRHKNIKFIIDGNTAVMHCLHRIEPAKGPAFSWIRATIVYSKINRKWWVTHEHISIPVDMMSGQRVFIANP